MDPLANSALLSRWSPYHYSFDNPLRFLDPTGKEGEGFLERLWNGVKSIFANVKSEPAEQPEQTGPLTVSDQQTIQKIENASENVKKNVDKLPEVGVVVGTGVKAPDPSSNLSGTAKVTMEMTTKGNVSLTAGGNITLAKQSLANLSVTGSKDGAAVSGGGMFGATSQSGGGVVAQFGFDVKGVSLTAKATLISNEKIKYESTATLGTWIFGLTLTLPR